MDNLDSRTPSRSALLVPVLCWLALTADGYDLFAYGATVPGLLAAPGWGATPASVGAVASLGLVGMLCGSLVAGTLTDLLGRRRLFAASVALFSLAMLGCGLAPSFAVFAAFRFLAGLGIGGLLPTAIALTSEFAAPQHRSRILGAVLTGPPVGGLLASAASVALLAEHGFQLVYGLGVIPLLLVPVALRLLPESPAYLRARGRTAEADEIAAAFGLPAPAAAFGLPAPAAVPAPAGRRSPVRTLFVDGMGPATLGIWVVTICSLLTLFGLSTWLPQIMRTAGYGLSSSVAFLLVYSAGGIVGTLVAAHLAQRLGAKALVLTGFAAATIALAVLAAQPPTGVVLVLVAVAGFGGLGTQNLLNDHVAGFYPAGARATGLGWALGVGRIGAIVGPTYGALFVGGGSAVVASAVAFAVPALLGALVMSRLPRSRPEVPVAVPTASVPTGGAA
ncbi:MFS transporter [Geodermatophilus sp. URMC 61]|uniref:MFS transporter n=1 Tax=Geodermatophilus sp. URMC 61 TaxID=3423411 RepID=UPI00406BED51